MVLWNSHIPSFHLHSSCHPRIEGSDALPGRQHLYPALWILVFTSGGHLTSSFPELLLIWGSGKAESMPQCLQAVQYIWKKHQWWSARGNHWDQSPAARAATPNLVAREQRVGCFLCKTGGKVEKSMWVPADDSKTGEQVGGACSCLRCWAFGFARHWHQHHAQEKNQSCSTVPTSDPCWDQETSLGNVGCCCSQSLPKVTSKKPS